MSMFIQHILCTITNLCNKQMFIYLVLFCLRPIHQYTKIYHFKNIIFILFHPKQTNNIYNIHKQMSSNVASRILQGQNEQPPTSNQPTLQQTTFIKQLIQFCKNSQRLSNKLNMQQIILSHNNQIFTHKVKITELQQQIKIKQVSYDLLQEQYSMACMERDQYYEDCKLLQEQIANLEDHIESQDKMREDMIKKYREDINQSVKDYFVLDNKRIQETGRLSVQKEDIKKAFVIERKEMEDKIKQLINEKSKVEQDLKDKNKENMDILEFFKQIREIITKNTNLNITENVSKKQVKSMIEFTQIENKEYKQQTILQNWNTYIIHTINMLSQILAAKSSMSQQLNKLQQYILARQGNNNFNTKQYTLVQRFDSLYEKQVQKFKKTYSKLQSTEVQLNQLFKKFDKTYQSLYGSQLLEYINIVFQSHNSIISEYKAKLQQKQNYKCQQCEEKAEQIQKLTKQIQLLNKQAQELNLCNSRQVKIISVSSQQKQKLKKDIQQYKNKQKQSENITKQFENRTKQLQQQNQKLINKIARLESTHLETKKSMELHKSKVQQYERSQIQSSQKQSRIVSEVSTKNKNLQNKLKNTEEQLSKIKQQFTKITQQLKLSQQKSSALQLQLKQKQLSLTQQKQLLAAKNDQIQTLQTNQQMLRQQYQTKITELQSQINQKSKNIERNLQIKTKIVQEIQKQVSQIVRELRNTLITQQICQEQKEIYIGSYKQAINILKQIIRQISTQTNNKNNNNNNNKTGCALFKLPSLIQYFQSDIQYIKNIIYQYTSTKQTNTKDLQFTTKFICKTDQKNLDFSKSINATIPNMFMICQTNKDIVFCIFIPKLTEKITEKYPIVIFNPNKKLRSPLQNKVVNGVRPSMLDASNTLVLGKQQIKISKYNDMTTTTNSADPYFANLDYMEMFGINKGEQSKLKSIQFYQIIFE